MKKSLKYFIVAHIFFVSVQIGNLNAQTLAPQVIASGGGYQSNAAGSLSFTIGETNTKTLTSATHQLTQGFQQPFELNLLNVKAFLQGYYSGSGQMQDVLYNQGEYASPSLITDTLIIELHNATSPYALAFQSKQTIKQDGSITIKGLGVVGQSYYLVLKHRNTIETWSGSPLLIQSITNYDFTTLVSQVYGDNQVEVEPGVWAFYSGDITQDGSIDAFDYLNLEPDIIAGSYGYLNTDLNGDGSVDAFDFLLLDVNVQNGIGASTP